MDHVALEYKKKSRLSYNFLYQSDVVTYLIWGTIVGLQVFNTFIILTYCYYMSAIAYDQHLLKLPKVLNSRSLVSMSINVKFVGLQGN